MTGDRTILFLVVTPLQELGAVACYADAWRAKFSHRAVDSLRKIRETLAAPTKIIRGTSNPDHLIFLNERILSAGSGAPFVVIIKPDGLPTPYVVSVGHRKDLKDQRRFETLWPAP
jgi:hypothetical protein